MHAAGSNAQLQLHACNGSAHLLRQRQLPCRLHRLALCLCLCCHHGSLCCQAVCGIVGMQVWCLMQILAAAG